MSFLTKVITGIFGKKSDKDLKILSPYVDKINELYQSFNSLSDNELIERFTSIRNETIKNSINTNNENKVDADRLDGNAFQDFMCEVLKANGFTDVSVTGQAGDQGGDLLAKRNDEQLVIQAKR